MSVAVGNNLPLIFCDAVSGMKFNVMFFLALVVVAVSFLTAEPHSEFICLRKPPESTPEEGHGCICHAACTGTAERSGSVRSQSRSSAEQQSHFYKGYGRREAAVSTACQHPALPSTEITRHGQESKAWHVPLG